MSSPSQPWLPFLPEKTRGAWHRQPCRLPLRLSLHQAPECGHRALPPRCPARRQQCETSRWLLRGAGSPGPGALIHQAAASRGEGMPRAAERCTWEDHTKTEQFSRRVKTAKIHPRGSSRNMNRPQTRGETAKVVKGLTPRMVKARHAALERGGMDRSQAGSWRGQSAAPGRTAEGREEPPRQNPAPSGRGGRGRTVLTTERWTGPGTRWANTPVPPGWGPRLQWVQGALHRGKRGGRRVLRRSIRKRRRPAEPGLAPRPLQFPPGAPAPALGPPAAPPEPGTSQPECDPEAAPSPAPPPAELLSPLGLCPSTQDGREGERGARRPLQACDPRDTAAPLAWF